MEIEKAVELIWESRKYKTDDPKAAISHLNEEVAESLKALHKSNLKVTKNGLENALSCLLIAMKMLDIDVEEAVNRQVLQMQTNGEKLLVISNNRAEIFVDGVLKGGWSVWSEEDIVEAEKIAIEFECKIVLKNEK